MEEDHLQDDGDEVPVEREIAWGLLGLFESATSAIEHLHEAIRAAAERLGEEEWPNPEEMLISAQKVAYGYREELLLLEAAEED